MDEVQKDFCGEGPPHHIHAPFGLKNKEAVSVNELSHKNTGTDVDIHHSGVFITTNYTLTHSQFYSMFTGHFAQGVAQQRGKGVVRGQDWG